MITQGEINLLDLVVNGVASREEHKAAQLVVGKLTGMLEREEWAQRDATHAPKTELPTMTGIHLCALQITIQKMEDEGEGEYTGGLREVLANVEAQVSGEAKLVPTAEIRELHEMTINPPNDSRVVVRAHYATSRWLTPGDER